MKYSISFFEGDSKMQAVEKLLRISLIKKACIGCILPEEDYASFAVQNHDDQCLTLSNDKYLIFLLLDINDFILDEIREAVDFVDHFIPVVVQLEETTDLSEFKNNITLTIPEITGKILKNGVSAKNPFLIFLRLLFEYKPY